MKVMYNVKPNKREYEQDKYFTYGKEYEVTADYRNRKSGQVVPDNGFIVIDNTGQSNMLFENEVVIIEDGEPCFIFEYSQ